MSQSIHTTSSVAHEGASLQSIDSGICCQTCGSDHLRRSRLRRVDTLEIAQLRWPVRCLHCNRRQYLSWMQSLRAASARSPHAGGPIQSWQSYTSEETPLLRDRSQRIHDA